MNEQKVHVEVMEEKEEEKQTRSALFEVSRKILLATVGAAALAQEEIENFLDNLVERGELAEKDARKLVKEVIEKREKVDQEKRAERQKKSGAATRTDIESLEKKIAELTKQIEDLKKEKGK